MATSGSTEALSKDLQELMDPLVRRVLKALRVTPVLRGRRVIPVLKGLRVIPVLRELLVLA